MKQLIILFLTLIALLTLSCSKPHPVPSSHSTNNTKGFLQRHLDSWLENDWKPIVKRSETSRSKEFKLQDYVNKAALYMKAHPSDENNSNVKRMEALPVIGKQR